ncbi:TPA: type IV secretion system protein VirB6 [Vibrio vulnificus]|uniref:type IV secretion system protein n=1 Tax=Vibrio TaxID=662 RepID=UPI0019093338|nr:MULTISPECIES: type IV secretion system protein [Vibrio]HAS6415138.1 type IV secretion system protein VirB6 [Vibrio vulnificus]EGQ8102306.1 type IV secretion system protein [Vibrio parahaemolyticus]EGQ8550027.1 type IV secretion system protein VirB6 [Vibrio parahaemolyticus]EGQ9287746.1 type IV secretion system protein [Vibrio parahaemolyticus]EJB8449472.1 type IV secretion system protein [Vibrio parahaemolyticus]
MDITIFQYISGSFENLLQAIAINGSQNIMDAIKPLVYTCVTIYIMMQCYLQIVGKTDDLAVDVFITCIIVLCVSNLVLNTGNYTTYIIGGVEALGEGLAGAIPSTGSSNLYQTLDIMLQTGVEQMTYCFNKAGFDPSTWTWVICGVVVMLAIGGLTVVAALIVIGTKFLLTMLLLVGPIFIIMACFPPTRRFLDSWMGKIFENILVQLFAVAIIIMMITIMERYISGNNLTDGEDVNPSAIIVQIAVIAAIIIYVLRQIPNLAGSLAGGFASAMLTLPKIMPKPDKRPDDSPDRITNRDTWQQQQQNQISGGGAKTGTSPKNDLSQDLRDRIAEHNLKNR